MKVLWSQLVLRSPGRRPPPSDSDVAASAPRTFGIIIQSIRSLQEVEQRRHISNAKLEEPVSASLVPEATENLVGKGVIETWCVENGYPKPVTDTICLEFTIVGQTQRFESVHRIVNNGGSVIFCSNRPPAEPDWPSPLELHVQKYSNNPTKKVIKAHHKEKLAVRSRTWPSKMESLRRWSRAPGHQHAKRKLQDKPLIRLYELKGCLDIRRPLADSDKINEHRGEEGEPLVRRASEDASENGASARIITPSIVATTDGDFSRNECAESQSAGLSDDVCVGRESDKGSLTDPLTRVAKEPELPWEPAFSQENSDSGARPNGEFYNTSESRWTPTAIARPDMPRLDDGLRTVKSATGNQDEDNTDITDFPGSNIPESVCGTSLGPGDHSPSVSDERLGAEESQMRARPRRTSRPSVQSGRNHSFLLDMDGSRPDHIIRTHSLLDFAPGVIGCNSIIKDISQTDSSLAQGLMQQGETGTGTVRGDICGCSEQEIASSGIRGYEETESSVKAPRGLDRATAKEDKGPDLAKSFQSAGSPNPVSELLGTDGNLAIHGIQYKTAATATSSKEVVESDSRKQDPDDSNETDTWDFCQVSEKASRNSSDGDGLPFPDDYWIYDEKAKNYYHKELGDDGKETISWYPLEFD